MRPFLALLGVSALNLAAADYLSDKRAYYCSTAYTSCLAAGNEEIYCDCEEIACLGNEDAEMQAVCASATATITAILPATTDYNPFASVLVRRDVCSTTLYGNTAFTTATTDYDTSSLASIIYPATKAQSDPLTFDSATTGATSTHTAASSDSSTTAGASKSATTSSGSAKSTAASSSASAASATSTKTSGAVARAPMGIAAVAGALVAAVALVV